MLLFVFVLPAGGRGHKASGPTLVTVFEESNKHQQAKTILTKKRMKLEGLKFIVSNTENMEVKRKTLQQIADLIESLDESSDVGNNGSVEDGDLEDDEEV